MEEQVDIEWLEEKLKNTAPGIGISKFLGADVKPALAKGENYASKMIRIRIKVSLETGEERVISIILKRMIDIPDPNAEFAVTLYHLFNSEHDVYANVLPHIETALIKENGEDNKFWADCYAFIPNKDIYFQDLNDFGYRVGDRKRGLDFDHSELMLRTLGRFHAASMVCINQGKVKTDKMRPYFMSLDDDNLRRSLSPSFQLMSYVMHNDWGSEWINLADKVSKLPEVIFQKMNESYQFDSSRINVINHGDFWVSNCMFKYDGSGKPTSIRFVDFQICHYNSYAWDLVYFLYTSVDTDLKETHLERLLSSYCESFRKTLEALNSPLPYPTVEHARSELARLSAAAVTSSICVRPVIMCDSEENVLKTDEIMTEHKGADGKKLLLFRNPVLTKILKVDLKDALSHIDLTGAMEDLVDLNWLENELKKNGSYDVSKILSVEITPAVAEGDNYASTLLRLKLKIHSNSGEEKELLMILKRNLDLTKFDKKDGTISNTLSEGYTREYNFYVNVFPQLEKYMGDSEKLRPECFASVECKDLYFEDLKESGYHLANRLTGLDSDHCNLVFRSFAKLHASSYIAIEQNLISVDEFLKYPMIDGTTAQKNRKSSAFDYVAEIVMKNWGPEWRDVANYLDSIKTTIKSKVEHVGKIDGSRINVINHGDPWVNNFMFKYDSKGKPTFLKFLDFQMPHYNSFAFDLSYFLNTSVSGLLKQKHLGSWIQTYCETFKTLLDLNNCQLPCPTPDIVNTELSRIAPFSLNVCVRVRPIIMCKPEDSLPLTELVKDNGLTDSKRRIYSNHDLAEVLKIDLPILILNVTPT